MSVGNYSLSALGGEKQKTTDVNNIKISGEVYDMNSNIKTTSFYDWNAKLDYYTGNITSTSIIRHNDSLSNANRNLFSKYVEDPMTLPTHTEYVNIKDFGNSFTVLLNSNSTVEDNFFKKSDDVKYSPKILELKNINYICHISVNFDVKTEIEFMTRSFLIDDDDNNNTFPTDNSSNYVIPNHAIFLNKTNHIYNTFTNFASINDTSLYRYDFTQNNKLSKGWNRLDIFILNDTTLDTTNKIHAFSLGFSFQLFKYTDNSGVLQQRVDKNTISYSSNLSKIYPLDGTLNLINNNFNIVSAYYPNTNKLFNITEQTVSILNANDINVTNEISENSEYLKDKYVLSGGNSKFLDIYIAEIPDENSDENSNNTCNLYLHLKFDTVNNDIKELLSYPQYMNIENSSVINAYKVKYGEESVELGTEYFKEIRDAFHIIGNSSLKLNQDKNSGYKYFLNVQLISNKTDNSSYYSFSNGYLFTLMFWFRYIKSNATTQYLIQMYNETDPKRSIFELFLKKDNDDRIHMHLFMSSVYDSSNGGIDHYEHTKIVENINFENNKWYHVSFAQYSDKSRLLINGINYDVTEDGNIKHKFRTRGASETYINIGANALTGDITGSIHQNLRSEKKNYTDFFVGNFDDLRYYNKYQPESFIAENIIGKVLYLTTNGLSAFGNTGISLSQFEQKIGIGTNEPVSNIHIKGDTYIDGLISVSSNIPELNIDNLNVESSVISNIEVLNSLKLNNIDAINQNINFFSNINSIERDYECNIEIYGTSRFFNTVSFDSQLISKQSESTNIPYPQTDAPVANFGDSFQLNVKQNFYKDKHEYHLTVPHENAGIDINIGQGNFTSKNANIETINVDTLKVNVAQVIPTLKIESTIENDRTINIANFTSEKIDIYQSCSFINTAKFEEKIWSSNTNTFTGINNFTNSIKAKTIDIIDHIKLNNSKIYSTRTQFELTDANLKITNATIENLTYNNLIGQDIAQTVSVNIAGNASTLNILYAQQQQISFNDDGEADYKLNFTIDKNDNNSQVDSNDNTKGYYVDLNDGSELQAKQITSVDSNFVSEDYFIVDKNEYNNSKVSYLLNSINAFSEDLNFDSKMWEAFLVIKYKQNFSDSENHTPTPIFRYKDFVMSIQDTQLNKAKILFNDSNYVPIVTNNWYICHIGQKNASGNDNEMHINVNGMNIGSYIIPFESTDGKYYFSNIDENIGSVLIDNIIFKNSTYKNLLVQNKFNDYLPLLQTIDGFGFIQELYIYSNSSNIDTGNSKIEPVFEINHGYIQTKNSLYVNIISDEFYVNYGNLIINEPALQYDYFSKHYPAAIFTKPLYTSNIYENVSTPLVALNIRQQSDLNGEYSQFATFELSKWSNTDLNLSNDDYSQTQLDFKLAHENFTNSSNILTLRSGGYVGINNNAPTSNLDISGNTRISGDLDVLKNVNITSNLEVHNKTYIYNELSVSSNTTLSNNLNINGNGIYSTSDSFDLLTSNVYTLNFGLHASNITIGSNIGNTIVENDLRVNGNSHFINMYVSNITLEGNELDSTSDTFNLLINCTTINFGNNATNVLIGSSETDGGSTYIKNNLVAEGHSYFEEDLTLSNNTIFVKGALTIGKYNGDDINIELHLGDEKGLLYVDTKSLDAYNEDEDFELFNSVSLSSINFASGTVNLNIGATNINVDSVLHIKNNTTISDSDFNSSNIIFREGNKDWGIYVAEGGQNNSLSGGNATIGRNNDIFAEALRLRVKESDECGFIIENSNEVELFSVNAYTGNTYIKGKTYINGEGIDNLPDLSVNGDVNILADLSVNGDVNILADLTVDGNVNISTDLAVNGDVNISTDLAVNGDVNISKYLTVDGGLTVNEGDVNIIGNLQVTNYAEISTDLTVQGKARIENDVRMGGNVGIGQDPNTAYKLDVNGDTRIRGKLNIIDGAGTTSLISSDYVGVNPYTHLTIFNTNDNDHSYIIFSHKFSSVTQYGSGYDNGIMSLKLTGNGNGVYDSNTIAYFPGNVGIGITNPSKKLEVNGLLKCVYDVEHEFDFGSPGNQTGVVFNVNSTGSRSRFDMANVSNGTESNRYFKFGYDTVAQLCIKQTGNVGIGITAPANKLDVNGDFSVNRTDDDWSSSPNPAIYMKFSSHDESGYIQSVRRSPLLKYPLIFEASKFNIKGGNVGIDTYEPANKLDVNGDFSVNSTDDPWSSSPNPSVYMRFNGVDDIGHIQCIKRSNLSIYPLKFYASKYSFEGGNVGIGTVVPAAKLDVVGDIKLTGSIYNEYQSMTFGSGTRWIRIGQYFQRCNCKFTVHYAGSGIHHLLEIEVKWRFGAGVNGECLIFKSCNSYTGTNDYLSDIYIQNFETSYSNIRYIWVKYNTSYNKSVTFYTYLERYNQLNTQEAKLDDLTTYQTTSPTGGTNFAIQNAVIQTVNYNHQITDGNLTISGNVGIGTTELIPDSAYKLDVNGSARIDNNLIINGNVGIGKPDPGYTLDVDGSINAGSSLSVNNQFYWSMGGHNMAFSTPGGKAAIMFAYTTDNIAFHLRHYNLSTIDNSYFALNYSENINNSIHSICIRKYNGNVGIGKTDPAHKLSVYGDDTTTTAANSAFISGFSDKLDINGWTGIGLGGYIQTLKSGVIHERLENYGRGSLHFVNNDVASVSDATIADAKMTIQRNGNVGIGTTIATDLLTLRALSPVISLQGGDQSQLRIEMFEEYDEYQKKLGFDIGYHGVDNYFKIRRYNNSTTPIDVISIARNTGNVGIGKTADNSYKLDVNGSVNTGALTATTGTFSGSLIATTGTFSGTVTTGNSLQVGKNTNDNTSKTIFFGGTYGDNSYNNCVIENRVYGGAGTEKRELLLYSGNDVVNGSGPDRIRLKAAEILFDAYSTTTSSSINSRTDETTKMIVKGDGKVGIGITTPDAKLHVSGDTFIVGELHVSADIIGFSTTIASDNRLKYNIQELNDENIIEKLKPVSFYWNDNIINETLRNKQDIGLIAQDVEEHIPIAVKEKQMMDGKKYKTINYNNIIPYLITSLQKAHSKINELEERLNNLM